MSVMKIMTYRQGNHFFLVVLTETGQNGIHNLSNGIMGALRLQGGCQSRPCLVVVPLVRNGRCRRQEEWFGAVSIGGRDHTGRRCLWHHH